MKITIVTTNKYPDGDAGAARQHCLAKALASKGNTITVLGMGTYTGAALKQYGGISYLSLRSKCGGVSGKVLSFLGMQPKLKRYLQHSEAVLVVDAPLTIMYWLRRYAAKNAILLIHDSVEWYSPEEFSAGKLHFEYLHNSLLNKYWVSGKVAVIAISHYLQNYFLTKGLSTIRIPPLMDKVSFDCPLYTPSGRTVMVYAGSPGRKDRLDIFMDGMSRLENKELSRVVLKIIGTTKEKLVDNCGVPAVLFNKLGNSLEIVGRIDRDKVLAALHSADYTILLRDPELRYAKAGFPSKIVESLSVGVPPLCNFSSDLDCYLTDLENCVEIAGYSAEDVTNAIRRAAAIPDTKRMEMHRNARRCAEENFDFRLYADKINDFIVNKRSELL